MSFKFDKKDLTDEQLKYVTEEILPQHYNAVKSELATKAEKEAQTLAELQQIPEDNREVVVELMATKPLNEIKEKHPNLFQAPKPSVVDFDSIIAEKVKEQATMQDKEKLARMEDGVFEKGETIADLIKLKQKLKI